MGRQLPPSHLKVPPGPTALPQRFLANDAVVVNHYSNSDKLIPAIPGFRTSAAFFTSLSANLRIDPDLPSPLGTPNSFRSGAAHPYLPPPSPLSFSTTPSHRNPYLLAPEAEIMATPLTPAPKAATDGLPALNTYTAESEEDRVEALRLVADSVAQQRQTASKMLIFHPFNLAAYFLAVAVLAKYMWHSDLLVLGTTIGGVTMACLTAVRFATGGYISLAEEINWEWLGEDRLIVVKWGEEVIGALVLGWAVVRAWTVKLKYRGKSVGEGMLEEAVKVAGERGADGIIFDRDHANSRRILPGIYNGFLDREEAKAEKALEKVADEKGNFRQRRSSPTWGSR
ncbi:hypothetical protein BS50DRAFT_139971 [Corynespora cassiicola Philippines]|uniref:N-acetyltransferase domain-containing protein n=1 Tax=Corynespora cassiicola Philippines TaxID=1448308 RepID=A0A2T2NA09_CORCC|nr:hypothetical protein BS50DRAFT_139971 [Corynespora cassiicola Philippines]